MAFGSLIMGTCEVCSVFLACIDQATKRWDDSLMHDMSFSQCGATRSVNSCIRSVNRNAYIQCAMHGKGLLASARDASDLMKRNGAHVFFYGIMFFFVAMKVMVALATAAIVYMHIQWKRDSLSITRVPVPVLFTVVGAYLVMIAAFDIYSMATNTIFFCLRM